MSSITLSPLGTVTLTLTANQSVAVYSAGTANVSQQVGYPNHPYTLSLLGTVSAGKTVFGPYSTGATIVIDAGPLGALYEVGTDAQVQKAVDWQLQGDPVALNATGALTAAAMLSGIVTSTTAAAVAGTIPTGTVMAASSTFAIGDSFDWSVINTGANSFTVTAATDHTVVGAAAVATGTSGRFRTRMTAATTFITYRIS